MQVTNLITNLYKVSLNQIVAHNTIYDVIVAGLIYAYERLPDDLEGKDQGVDPIIHVLVTSAVGSRMIGREKGHGGTVGNGREARRGMGGAERLTFARRTITYMRVRYSRHGSGACGRVSCCVQFAI